MVFLWLKVSNKLLRIDFPCWFELPPICSGSMILNGPEIVSASYGGGTMAVSSLAVESGNLWVNFEGPFNGGLARIDFATSVPEPATIGLLGIGLLGLRLARGKTMI